MNYRALLAVLLLVLTCGCGGSKPVAPDADENTNEPDGNEQLAPYTVTINGTITNRQTSAPVTGVEVVLKFGAIPYTEPYGDARDFTDQDGQFTVENSEEDLADGIPHKQLAIRLIPDYAQSNPIEFEGRGAYLYTKFPFELTGDSMAAMDIQIDVDRTENSEEAFFLYGHVTTDGQFAYDGMLGDDFEHPIPFNPADPYSSSMSLPMEPWGGEAKKVLDGHFTGSASVVAIGNSSITASGTLTLSLFGIPMWTREGVCGLAVISTSDYDQGDILEHINVGDHIIASGRPSIPLPDSISGYGLSAYRLALQEK